MHTHKKNLYFVKWWEELHWNSINQGVLYASCYTFDMPILKCCGFSTFHWTGCDCLVWFLWMISMLEISCGGHLYSSIVFLIMTRTNKDWKKNVLRINKLLGQIESLMAVVTAKGNSGHARTSDNIRDRYAQFLPRFSFLENSSPSSVDSFTNLA